MKNLLIITCAILSLVLLSSFVEKKTLVVGTNAEFPPFSLRENEKIVGFDIDIIQEIAKRLQKDIVIKDLSFDALIPELTLGHLDCAVGGISFTEERAKRVLFTKAYLSDDPLVIVTLDSNIKTLDDLKGKKIVVNEGYTADLFVTSKGFDPVRLMAPADAFMAIKSKRLDAFITAKSTVLPFLEKQKDSGFIVQIVEGTAETYAFAVSKQNPELHKEIDKKLQEMIQDGTIENFKKKWKLS